MIPHRKELERSKNRAAALLGHLETAQGLAALRRIAQQGKVQMVSLEDLQAKEQEEHEAFEAVAADMAMNWEDLLSHATPEAYGAGEEEDFREALRESLQSVVDACELGEA